MLHRTAVINLVALTNQQLAHMPRLQGLMQHGTRCNLTPTLPAVTCTSQSTMLTGALPSQHGIVGNGWHDRERAETHFWKQSNRLVHGEKIWDRLKRADPSFTCANCFWWYAMYADVDITVTPRPMYPADGRKIPDIWTRPSELRDDLQRAQGQFPLFKFWGPAADISSSAWIADAVRHVDQHHDPTLLLAYLPHLDYGLQKYGPDDPRMATEATALDDVVSSLIEDLMARDRRILIVNEYAIVPVQRSVAPNLVFRDAGLLNLRHECGRLYLDAGASRAFAVTDHQIAHIYIANAKDHAAVLSCVETMEGVDQVLSGESQAAAGLNHERSGDIVLVAKPDAWFRHDWWHRDDEAPDFQDTVDIHRKPGFDPRELFIDPNITWPRLTIAWKLLKRKIGMRSLLNVVPLNPDVVQGSHGRCDTSESPLLWSSHSIDIADSIPLSDVSNIIETLSQTP